MGLFQRRKWIKNQAQQDIVVKINEHYKSNQKDKTNLASSRTQDGQPEIHLEILRRRLQKESDYAKSTRLARKD